MTYLTSTTAPRYLSGGGNADSDPLTLAVNVGTGLFECSAVAIVVEGGQVRECVRTGLRDKKLFATEAEVTFYKLEITVGDRHVCYSTARVQ